jgi:hypothetical protein
LSEKNKNLHLERFEDPRGRSMKALGGELHTLGGRCSGQSLDGQAAPDGKKRPKRAYLSSLDKGLHRGGELWGEPVRGVLFASKDLADARQQCGGVAELCEKSSATPP